MTHRKISSGEIPEGLLVLHHCDNPPCVRGRHLHLGDDALNADEMMARGRHARLHGEAHGCARLIEADVITIRSRHAAGGVSYRELAREFGVDPTQISGIVRRKYWAHLDATGVVRG